MLCKKEFLYDFEKGHGEYEPCIWMTIKCIKGQAFRIEALLPNYGAIYDKLPLHAFVTRQTDLKNAILPLDYLQIWDCLSYNFTVIEKDNLRIVKVMMKTGEVIRILVNHNMSSLLNNYILRYEDKFDKSVIDKILFYKTEIARLNRYLLRKKDNEINKTCTASLKKKEGNDYNTKSNETIGR